MKRLLLVLAIIFACYYAQAVTTPVSTVYRTDNRPPATVIAAGGFLPWLDLAHGGDRDLVNHVEGTTVENRTTAFVSTSARIEGALRSLGQIAFGSDGAINPEFSSYLYEIRPFSDNSFQVSQSLIAASTTAESLYRRRALVDLNNTMNDGIFEVVTLDGFPANRIIRYAEVTPQMLRETALASMFNPTYWTERWIPLDSYSHTFDGDTLTDIAYPAGFIGTPDGRGFVAENSDLQEETEPLGLGCFGVCGNCTPTKLFNSPSSGCDLRLKTRYVPYTLSLRYFLLKENVYWY